MAFESFEDASALYPYDSDANINHLVVPSRSRKKQRRRRSICRNPNYNSQQKKIQFIKKRELIYSPKSSIIPTMINSPTPTHEYSFNFMRSRTVTKYPQKRRRQKRRIRTFYSKKWGNRLYNIVQSNYPILNPPKSTPNYPLNPIQADIQLRHTPHLPFCCQQDEIAALHTFVEEENLDLNDIKSVRSVSPSVSPIHLNISPGDHDGIYYDSAISNIAATTEDEEEKLQQQRRQCAIQNNNIHNINTNNNHNNTNNSKFKIIVSAPDEFTDADRINDALLRQQMKLRKRGFMGSDIESAASSDDCSSCEEYDGHSSGNDEDDEDEPEQEEVEDDDDDVDDEDSIYNQQHKLFLSHNNLDRGIYSRFEYSDSETDYLSAQSDDYEELTICYRNRQDRNIKFRRDQHLNVADCNYLSDLGPSDIGSSDTDCFSSADSIPDSLPPPVQPQFIAM